MNLDRFIEEFLFLDEQMTGIEGDPVLPATAALHQPFPNPFSVSSIITFELPQAGHVRLDVYDISGRLVETAYSGMTAAGEHSVQLDGSSLAAGVYLVRLAADGFTRVTRAVLLR